MSLTCEVAALLRGRADVQECGSRMSGGWRWLAIGRRGEEPGQSVTSAEATAV